MPDQSTVETITSVVLVLGAIIGGAWGLYTYARGGRLAKAQWMNEIVQAFLFDERFVTRRKLVEDHYVERVSDVVDRWLQGYYPRDSYPDVEVDTWKALDAILSHYEFMLHLEEQGYLNRGDRDVLLTWWLETYREPRYANLRIYLPRWQYRRIATTLGFVDQEYVWLDEAERATIPPDVWRSISGRLTPAASDVWAVTDRSVFEELDPVFEYVLGEPGASRRVRRCRLTTSQPVLPAWRYELPVPVESAPAIAS